METAENLDDCTDNNEYLTDNIKTQTGNPDECTDENIELTQKEPEKPDEDTETEMEITEILPGKPEEVTEKKIEINLDSKFNPDDNADHSTKDLILLNMIISLMNVMKRKQK